MAVDLAVIDPGMGNLRSVVRAWEHVGATVRLVACPGDLGTPDALIFPGQGAIVDCMATLKETGFDTTIRDWIRQDKPFFGICLGLQALFEFSEEGKVKGLGLFPGRVVRFRLGADFKIPHMGWNTVSFNREPAGEGIRSEGDAFYFVHSYHVVTEDKNLIWGETTYGYPFVSAIRKGNCFATQFHPEKSQAKGLQMYANFLQYVASKKQ